MNYRTHFIVVFLKIILVSNNQSRSNFAHRYLSDGKFLQFFNSPKICDSSQTRAYCSESCTLSVCDNIRITCSLKEQKVKMILFMFERLLVFFIVPINNRKIMCKKLCMILHYCLSINVNNSSSLLYF